ncbi:MAG: DoxX family protein [Phycisphaerae bacterium]|nr:DoxX family protein [Phycisphaerae bacterium]
MFDNFRVRLSGFGPLVLRIGLGLGFMTHGWLKLVALHGGNNPLAGLLGKGWLGMSLGWTMGITEFFGGLFVLIGLLTRFWAAGLTIGMTVALSTAHRADFVPFIKSLWAAAVALFTKPADFSGRIMDAAAAFKPHLLPNGYIDAPELAWAYIAAAIALFLMGPGAVSVDYILGLIIRGRKRNAVVGLGMRYPAKTDNLVPPPQPILPPTPLATSAPPPKTGETTRPFKMP